MKRIVFSKDIVIESARPSVARCVAGRAYRHVVHSLELAAGTRKPAVRVFRPHERCCGAGPNHVFDSVPARLPARKRLVTGQAVLAARKERGHEGWFSLQSPATVERVREACLVESGDLDLKPS